MSGESKKKISNVATMSDNIVGWTVVFNNAESLATHQKGSARVLEPEYGSLLYEEMHLADFNYACLIALAGSDLLDLEWGSAFQESPALEHSWPGKKSRGQQA